MKFVYSKMAFHTPAAGSVTTDVTVTTYNWSQVRLLRRVISVLV